MESYQKSFISLALSHQALKFGEFTLKSGRKSPYFFNVGQLHSGLALKGLGECYATAIHQSKIAFDVLFGPAYKGIPLVCTAAVAMAALFEKDVPYSFNRKEVKDHGEGGQIVGAPLNGRIFVLDDVITAGTAMRESFEIIQSFKGKIAGILVALDRQEKGQAQKSAIQELQAEHGVPVLSLITFSHIMEYISEDPVLTSYGPALAAYRDQYGV